MGKNKLDWYFNVNPDGDLSFNVSYSSFWFYFDTVSQEYVTAPYLDRPSIFPGETSFGLSLGAWQKHVEITYSRVKKRAACLVSNY